MFILLHALTAAVLLAWLCTWLLPTTSAWVQCVLLLPACLPLWGLRQGRRLWPPGPAWQLAWTGQAWHLLLPGLSPPQPALQAVQVALDLGSWMLVHTVSDQGRHRWHGASAGQAGAAWHGLRVALRAHAGAGAHARLIARGTGDV